MKPLTLVSSYLAASVLAVSVIACSAHNLSSGNTFPSSVTRDKATIAVTPAIATDANGQIKIEPLAIAAELKNPWTPELEKKFWQRANEAIHYYAGKSYGNTYSENEKKSYPLAMFDFLAGNREKAIAFLQSKDDKADDNQHTEGIDYYFCFTLKGQLRKYFFFGSFLDPAYRQRMFDGAKRWTEEDPNNRPHPIYGRGRGGNGWGPDVRGSWVDKRNTDNLRAMRDTSIYLMAEETGNEEVREKYKGKLQQYVRKLYHIGMGEWDSENYLGHTIAPYLNLYDFAKDPEVKQLAKAALDWLSAVGAVKYYRGGFGGPTKRDYGASNVVYGAATARFLWIWFGDAPIANPDPERDVIHAITSAYRPPAAVVALAHKQFTRPVELLSTKPIYENWKLGGENEPGYWETTFFGHNYQLGSVAGKFADGDVGPFKLMAYNSKRGVDYFVANTGGDRVKPGKNKGDQIGQYRNLAIWLRRASDTPFFFQVPKSAKAEIADGIWFFQFEKTWLAIYPINLSSYSEVTIQDKKLGVLYSEEVTLKATITGDRYAGFALEVGEQESQGSYADFKQAVKNKSKVDLSAIASGTVQLTGAIGGSLKLTHNSHNDLPTIVRNGKSYDWFKNFDLYQSADSTAPISLGWKKGTLHIEAGGSVFESTLSKEGQVSFYQK